MVVHLTGDVIRSHVDAFNGRDLDQLIAGFTEDAVWITGGSIACGRAEVKSLFAVVLAAFRPRLTVQELLVDGDLVACQMTETLTIDGTERTVPIAIFFTLKDGLIDRAKVYREGSATTT